MKESNQSHSEEYFFSENFIENIIKASVTELIVSYLGFARRFFACPIGPASKTTRQKSWE